MNYSSLNLSQINPFGLSSICVLLLSGLMAVLVFSKSKDKRLGRIWGCFCVVAATWGVGGFMVSLSTVAEKSFFWWQIGHIGVIYPPLIYFHFIYVLTKINKRGFLIFSYVIAGIFTIINFFFPRIFIGEMQFVFNQFYWLKMTNVSTFFYVTHYVFFYFIVLGYAFFKLILAFRRSAGIKRLQLKYIVIGSLLGWVGAEANFLPTFNLNIYPIANFLIGIYPIPFAYAIVKYRLMDIRVALTRAGIALAVYSFFFGVPFYLGAKFNNWFLSTSVAVALAVPAPIIYRYFRIKAERILLAQQQRYQKILLQAGTGMVKEHNLTRLLKLIVYIVKRVVGITYAAAFSHDAENDNYVLRVVRDHQGLSTGKVFGGDEPLIDYIRKNAFPMSPQEIPYNLRRPLEEAMGTSFDLIVPSVVEGKILGFLLLGNKLDNSAYSHDDINVFRILSHQISLAIENCLFFDEFKKAQERIFNAEKLASIGGMADGVAHQIKNRLNHFSLASGKIKIDIDAFLRHNPHAIKDPAYKAIFTNLKQTADSMVNNVKHTDTVLKGILDYARTQEKDISFDTFSLKETINYAIDLLKIKHSLTHPPITLELNDTIDTIYGIKAQIMEVLFNLIDNAYEATQKKRHEQPDYRPQITVSHTQDKDYNHIVVADNGIGVKEEDKPKIFALFHSTKSLDKEITIPTSGSGVGMYIVRRLIEEHHKGEVHFESQYMKGSRVAIRLRKTGKI